jgi:hypothetical protein
VRFLGPLLRITRRDHVRNESIRKQLGKVTEFKTLGNAVINRRSIANGYQQIVYPEQQCSIHGPAEKGILEGTGKDGSTNSVLCFGKGI